MNLKEAKSLYVGQIIFSSIFLKKDGTPEQWRVSGKVRTWKRNPTRIIVPIRHGFYNGGYITETNIHEWEIDIITALGICITRRNRIHDYIRDHNSAP